MLIKLIHGNIDLYLEINEEARKASLKQLLKIKSDLKEHKATIIKEELSLIKQINSVAQKTLELAKFQEKKLDELILKIQNLKKLNYSKETTFIKSILNLPPTDLLKIQLIKCPKLVITSWSQKQIKKIFKLNELSEENFLIDMNYENDKCLLKFIEKGSNILSIYNIETNNFDKKTLPIKIDYYQNYGPVCFLPNGSMFHYYSSPLIIDPDNSIRYLPKWKRKESTLCSIYIHGDIYIFGWTRSPSAKFSISKNKWISLSTFLINLDAYYASPFIFNNYILLGSTKRPNSIFYYDTIIDSFSEASFSNLQWVPKKFFVVNESLYFTDYVNRTLGMTENLVTWKEIKGPPSSLDLFDIKFICSPVIYNQKLYYLRNHDIFSFDLKKKKAEFIYVIPNWKK